MRHVSDAYVYKYNHARAHNIHDTNAYVSHCVCVRCITHAQTNNKTADNKNNRQRNLPSNQTTSVLNPLPGCRALGRPRASPRSLPLTGPDRPRRRRITDETHSRHLTPTRPELNVIRLDQGRHCGHSRKNEFDDDFSKIRTRHLFL